MALLRLDRISTYFLFTMGTIRSLQYASPVHSLGTVTNRIIRMHSVPSSSGVNSFHITWEQTILAEVTDILTVTMICSPPIMPRDVVGAISLLAPTISFRFQFLHLPFQCFFIRAQSQSHPLLLFKFRLRNHLCDIA